MWVPLLEKAYAKAYSCYVAISGGHIPEAMFDLTGVVSLWWEGGAEVDAMVIIIGKCYDCLCG